MNATTLAHGIAARTFPEIRLQVASTREQREAVFRLIYHSYRDAGLCEPDFTELRFTPYQLLPTTDLFLAQLHEEVVCTLSLVRDGELGLPMEDLYAEQIEQRRAAGLHLAEVSCLADCRSDPSRFFELFCDLSRLMVQSAEYQSVDQLLIAVHPRHAYGFPEDWPAARLFHRQWQSSSAPLFRPERNPREPSTQLEEILWRKNST